ncbi:LuxR family transcriptional regulator [Streptacidiphilus sp. PB12-B1b]|uniref:LuxR C-terminal-related transcriptional regulator n=1 Tax=Streptacidiphilus sp. PB12-B1b TaxID=2705012 RepID=UPI001CDBBA9F|nr:LuxR C-terminal-related transcriptional regulator [Streptacidiphilus sp. PB12-B1b]QMU77436.1 LuxR family transcriptional regulator [Streptacidiphilus sp. PB12-B1b]
MTLLHGSKPVRPMAESAIPAEGPPSCPTRAEQPRKRPARRRARHGDGETASAFTERLTALDACILEGVAAGASTAELAAALFLSRQGVEYHIGLMLRQFQVPNRAALVSRAHSAGVLGVGVWPPRVVADFVE